MAPGSKNYHLSPCSCGDTETTEVLSGHVHLINDTETPVSIISPAGFYFGWNPYKGTFLLALCKFIEASELVSNELESLHLCYLHQPAPAQEVKDGWGRISESEEVHQRLSCHQES